MDSTDARTTRLVRFAFVLLFGTLLVSGCSSSGSGSDDSIPADSQSSNDNESSSTEDETISADDVATDQRVETDNGAPADAITEPTNDESPVDSLGLAPDEGSTDSIVDVPDQLEFNSTRMTFDITVPAISSDELQVRVVWGDIQETAMWVADEYWTLSIDYPLDTEHELVVTFYDRNGDVTLASYESTFRTGFNSAESYQIFADQFDSDRWDADADGISNLDESILGGDSVQLELRDSYFTNSTANTFSFRTEIYESQLPAERPYYEFREEVPDTEGRPDYIPARFGLTRTLTIDIDEAGTGTFEDYQNLNGVPPDYQIWSYSATRTNTGDSVIWKDESTYDSQGEFIFYYISSVENKRINAQTRSADGTYSARWNGSSGPARITLYKYALVGEPIVDSPLCEPTSGTVMQESVSNGVWRLNRISKGADDQFWTVVETSSSSQDYPWDSVTSQDYPAAPSNLHADIDDTYLTRTLGATFYCSYPELD